MTTKRMWWGPLIARRGIVTWRGHKFDISGKEIYTATYVFLFFAMPSQVQTRIGSPMYHDVLERRQNNGGNLHCSKSIQIPPALVTYDDIQDRGIIWECCGQAAASRWTHTRNDQGLSSRMYCTYIRTRIVQRSEFCTRQNLLKMRRTWGFDKRFKISSSSESHPRPSDVKLQTRGTCIRSLKMQRRDGDNLKYSSKVIRCPADSSDKPPGQNAYP